MPAKRMTLTSSFAAFGAELPNYRKTSSAIAKKDGALVISLWTVFFTPSYDPPRRYEDTLKRWKNPIGRELAREHLRLAFTENRPVRLVMAFPKDPEALLSGKVVTGGNSWRPYKDVVGKIRSFKRDEFVIDFRPVR